MEFQCAFQSEPASCRIPAGTQFDLTIGETAVNITGSERQAKTINGGLPGPVLRWKEGDTITLRSKTVLMNRRPFTGTALFFRPIWMVFRG